MRCEGSDTEKIGSIAKRQNVKQWKGQKSRRRIKEEQNKKLMMEGKNRMWNDRIKCEGRGTEQGKEEKEGRRRNWRWKERMK